MSATYPDLDVTDPQEPVYDDPYREFEKDPAFIEFITEQQNELFKLLGE